ncbi:MAG: hypothetical protein MR274_06465 [Clostridium sp.]|nr:hypothetical protein [Clostridium sp.]
MKALKKNRVIAAILIGMMATTCVSCELIDSSLVKLGLRNEDFDYVKNNKVDKIVIQSARDTAFRFIVTDENAIQDIYEILRNGKIKDTKTDLQPDYTFEVYYGEEVKKYSYVAYLEDSDVGNFYDENKSYYVSKNLDQKILQNLSFIRKTKDFDKIYYDSILEVLKVEKDNLTGQKVGINLTGDVDCLKYIFAVDLENFKKDIKDVISTASLVENNEGNYDTVVKVQNKGYSSKIFKTTVIVDNKKSKVYRTYYVQGNYEHSEWNIAVSEPDKKPNDW